MVGGEARGWRWEDRESNDEMNEGLFEGGRWLLRWRGIVRRRVSNRRKWLCQRQSVVLNGGRAGCGSLPAVAVDYGSVAAFGSLVLLVLAPALDGFRPDWGYAGDVDRRWTACACLPERRGLLLCSCGLCLFCGRYLTVRRDWGL